MNIKTKCVHNKLISKEHKPVTYPIYQTATFHRPSLDDIDDYNYTRISNPTRNNLEEIVASLEQAKHCLAFSSGMAAIHSLSSLLTQKDHIIILKDIYGGTNKLFEDYFNVEFTYIDELTVSSLQQHRKPNTKLIFIETPTNPMMNITNIKEVCDYATKHNIITVVDNTFLTPLYQNPITLGADIVIHSGSKYLSGHNDTIAGFVVTSNNSYYETIYEYLKITGATLAPFDAFLVTRGIKTLHIRLKQSQKNAMKIAEFLSNHPKVNQVYYPNKNNKDYDIHIKQSSGSGSMISFTLHSKEAAQTLLKNLNIIYFAESLGGVESLITYPFTQTHSDVEDSEKIKRGITESLLRLSVGIEDINDLINDLERGLSYV